MKLVFNAGRSLLAGVVLLAVLLTACAAPETQLEPVTLKLGWQDGSQFLGFYVADSLGYYAEEGLVVTLEELSDSVESISVPERVVSGEFDFAVGGPPVLAQNPDVPITAISAFYQFGPAALFAQVDSGIVTLADLAGRRVVVKSSAWQTLLEELLEREGLTLDDVEEVPGGFDMTPFFEGDVEVWAGYLTNEVVRARLQGLELVTFPLHEYGMRSTGGQLIFTGQASLETDPQRAERFLRASLRGWQWAVDNPSEAVDIMLERFPEMADDRDFHLASFEASIPLIIPGGSRLGEIDCATWLSYELFADLESTENLCTTEIFETVSQ